MKRRSPHEARVLQAAALLAVALLAAPPGARAEGPPNGSWSFRVLLDGKPIGQHRFTLKANGLQRELRSEAAFDVKLLGFTAYRYRHEATEQWQGDCIAGLAATTDDDGKLSSVQARQEGAVLSVQSPQGSEKLEGCAMSFAYWNPAMLSQTRLLNAQTGRFEVVKIEALGEAKLQVHGQTVDARRYRITGPEQPIELWYSAQGDWLALESTVTGGKRKLSYRRE